MRVDDDALDGEHQELASDDDNDSKERAELQLQLLSSVESARFKQRSSKRKKVAKSPY